jgi:hypothetical protein
MAIGVTRGLHRGGGGTGAPGGLAVPALLALFLRWRSH